MEHTEIKYCGDKKKYFREYKGDRFWRWENRGLYASQRGGKLRLLHREIYKDFKGEIGSSFEVIFSDGDIENYDVENISKRVKNSGRKQNIKHEPKWYKGKKFYRKPNGYYKLPYEHGGTYMHRFVWADIHGEIPPGYHIHHINGDKSDNRIDNLECIQASKHTRLHSRSSKWIGSEENKKQIKLAGEKAKEWHRSQEGRKWHSEHAKKAFKNRKKYPSVCTHCGTDYETYQPKRSIFCSRSCKSKSYNEKQKTRSSI